MSPLRIVLSVLIARDQGIRRRIISGMDTMIGKMTVSSMRRPPIIVLLALTLLSTLSGCARYEYDIVQPADLAQHMGSDGDVVFARDPLLYRMRTYENHLVIQIHNPTTQPITLMGGQSFVVDPQGQSHPLRTRTIAPDAFIKLILPPEPPDLVPAGPTLGIGLDVGTVHPYGPGGMYGLVDDPFWYTPRYYMAVDPEGAPWTWRDEGDVRLGLVFQRWNGPPFDQQFVFHRRKM